MNKTQAFQCDILPVMGTSVLIEIEVSDDESSNSLNSSI